MLAWLTIFFLLLIILFFLSRKLTQHLFLFFFLLTKKRETSISILTWLLLPGTIIHELSHLLVAGLLRVPTGELSFIPEVKEDKEIKAGGLKIAKTGPLRHSLIGLAPTIVGLLILFSLTNFILIPYIGQPRIFFKNLSQISRFQFLIFNFVFLLVLSFSMFVVAGTMFSSKKDLEKILFPLIIIAVLGIAFWLGNFNLSLPEKIINSLTQIFKTLCLSLTIVCFFDLLILVFVKGLASLLPKKPLPALEK